MSRLMRRLDVWVNDRLGRPWMVATIELTALAGLVYVFVLIVQLAEAIP